MLSEREFFNRLAAIPGGKIDGDVVKGIRLLTPDERQQRADNAEEIRRLVCTACGADERSCSSQCRMMLERVHKKIAARIPLGVKLYRKEEASPPCGKTNRVSEA